MRVTIIKPDNMVGVDGEFLELDLSSLPNNLHAMQWYEDHGHEEWTDGDNTDISSLTDYQHLYDEWQAQKIIKDGLALDPYYGMSDVDSRPLRVRDIINKVDLNTSAVIASYHHVANNKDYNLSEDIRQQLLDIKSQAEVSSDPASLFPVDVSIGIDETTRLEEKVTIGSVTTFKAVYLAVLDHVLTVRRDARTLKESISSLTNQELKDWADPRV